MLNITIYRYIVKPELASCPCGIGAISQKGVVLQKILS
jgi:hypothetical protein